MPKGTELKSSIPKKIILNKKNSQQQNKEKLKQRSTKQELNVENQELYGHQQTLDTSRFMKSLA